MGIGFDALFGLHQVSLDIRTVKAELIASNLAHADTPGYQAKDVDFKAVLAAYGGNAPQTQASGAMQLAREMPNVENFVKTRDQLHPSMDGNTVNPHKEYIEFAENTQRYMASLSFLKDNIKTMMAAIKGDR